MQLQPQEAPKEEQLKQMISRKINQNKNEK